MAYLVSGILYLSPGKILCNTGDGYVAFTISNDEKSALTKLRLRLGCVREQTWHCSWSDHEWWVVYVLPCFYRSGIGSRLHPAPSNFCAASRVRWCETISVRKLWQAESPTSLALQHQPECLWHAEFLSTEFEGLRFAHRLAALSCSLTFMT